MNLQKEFEMVMNSQSGKNNLRKEALKMLKELEPISIDYLDIANAEYVLAYIPLKTEINIKNAIDNWLQKGIKVAFPTNNPQYFAVANTDWKNKLVTLDNKTQTVQTNEFIDVSSINRKTTIIVPGLLFTEDGKRLGRGLGFYDRVLSFAEGNKLVKTIGLCRPEQVVKSLPLEETDKAVNTLCIV